MKATRYGIALIAFSLLFATVSGETVDTPADQVRAAETAFAKSMADRDHEAFARHVSAEAVFFAPGGVTMRGKKAVVDGWAPLFEGPQAPFSWEPELVEVLPSGKLAFSAGPVRDPQGTRVGTYHSVWRLEKDGRWRVVFDNGCPPCG